MRITALRARRLEVPVTLPLSPAPRLVPLLLAEVDTDAGACGHALFFAPMASAVLVYLRDEATPLLVGAPARPEAVREILEQRMPHRPTTGAWATAASLVDIAVWDALGQRTQTPVWQLLGGARAEVEAYVTFGLPAYGRTELVRLAEQLVGDGHRGLKLVVGAQAGQDASRRNQSLRADAERIHAVRAAVGPDVDLMIDANKRLTLPQAVALADAVGECDLTWFEDPVTLGDPSLMAQARDRIAIPIAGGSLGMGNVATFHHLVSSGAIDIAQPNVRDLGGFTGARRAMAIAEAHHLPVAMGGNWPHLNAHLYAGVARSGPVEFHLQGWEVARLIYHDAIEPHEGRLAVGDAPGLGLTLRQDLVERFTVP